MHRVRKNPGVRREQLEKGFQRPLILPGTDKKVSERLKTPERRKILKYSLGILEETRKIKPGLFSKKGQRPFRRCDRRVIFDKYSKQKVRPTGSNQFRLVQNGCKTQDSSTAME